jgi:hypothetical protein
VRTCAKSSGVFPRVEPKIWFSTAKTMSSNRISEAMKSDYQAIKEDITHTATEVRATLQKDAVRREIAVMSNMLFTKIANTVAFLLGFAVAGIGIAGSMFSCVMMTHQTYKIEMSSGIGSCLKYISCVRRSKK